MAILFIDDGILQDPNKWSENKESFESSMKKYIVDHYTGKDSADVYALFTPEQINVLQWYYKGYSIEEYRDLAHTVDLQIQERDAKVKAKIKNLCEYMGISESEMNDWEYDGMVDAGPNANFKCDLCPRPVRYAHYAVNKKTHECLRFGCNCGAEFFNVGQGDLNSLKSVQARTLRDLKIIACVVENQLYEGYYKYMCGYVGRVYLENGIEGLRDLMTFSLEWEDDHKKIKGDVLQDSYPVHFGDNHVENKPLEWIKLHIVSCTNADLDEDMYSELSVRSIVYSENKELSDKQVNNSFYITYAIKCLEVDLPVPYSICQKINQITSRVARQHHPDYIKYAEELLLQRNLANNSLLRMAFKEFIVNYLSSSMGIAQRDVELACWGIRGQKTYYDTVLNWEAMITKLITIKQIDDMLSEGLITEDEWRLACKLPSTAAKNSYIRYSSDIPRFLKKAKDLFLVDGEVIKDENEVVKGFSKYSLKGVNTKIELDLTKLPYDIKKVNPDWYLSGSNFTPDIIPYQVGLCYIAYQQGFKSIVSQSIKYVYDFTETIVDLGDIKEVVRFLCALKGSITDPTKIVHLCSSWYRYGRNYYSRNDIINRINEYNPDENMVKQIMDKYSDKITEFISDCKTLHDSLEGILKGVEHIKFEFVKKKDINDDYDAVVNKTEKSACDYFADYTNMLIDKRNSQVVSEFLRKNSILDVCAFKGMEKYADMMRDIIQIFLKQKQAIEEKRVYEVMGLGDLKSDFEKLASLSDVDFMKLVIASWGCLNYKSKVYDSKYVQSSTISRILPYVKNAIPNQVETLAEEKLLPYFSDLQSDIKELCNYLTPQLTYSSYLDLLNVDTSYVREQLKSVINAEGFKSVLSSELSIKKYVSNSSSYYSGSNIKDYLENIKMYNKFENRYNELNTKLTDFYNEIFEAIEKAEREQAEKDRLIFELEAYLKEHIKFFEVDVDALRRTYSDYTRKSESAIRRAEAFRTIHYEKDNPLTERVIRELELYGRKNWSECVDVCVDKAKEQINQGMLVEKRYFEPLPAELYYKNLIFNHLNVLYLVLKDMKTIDLKSISKEDLILAHDTLRVYYIFKSDFENIVDLVKRYGHLTVDVQSELAKLPVGATQSPKEVYESYFEKPDSTGYTGVEKAKLVYNHTDFNTLPEYLKPIIKSVALSRNPKCSKKQLVQVNKGFEQLGLGHPDPVDLGEETQKPADGSKSEAEEMCELASKLQAMPDFKKLPSWMQGIVNTLALNYKKGSYSCSGPQKKYLLQAKDKLGV